MRDGEAVTVEHVRAWADRAAARLEAARAALDAANSFPVPDHDTGSNLAETAHAAASALAGDADPADVATALRHLATGAVGAARGNSGVILSQLWRGFADAADGGEWDLPRGFALAARAARAAVADPVEGTVLTVADAAAAAVADAAATPAAVVAAALTAAGDALRATAGRPPAGPVGVPDAGAHGYVEVLTALHEALTGGASAQVGAHPATGDCVVEAHVGTPGGPAYEVQYLLRFPGHVEPAAAVATLVEALRPLGDSLVVADDGAGLWAVHVHVDDVGAAIEAGAAAAGDGGRMSGVRVVRFAVTDPVPAAPVPDTAAPTVRRAVVVVGGEEVEAARRLFGATAGEVLGPGDPFPAGELVAVAVGPAATAAAMRHADQAAGVSVIPAQALVQALAAVAVHDPDRRGVDDTVAMAEAAAGCRHASLAVAPGESLTIVGRAQAGDVLGLLGEEVAVIGADAGDVARRLLDRLFAAGGELVTVLHRTDAAELAAQLAEYTAWRGDHLEIEVVDAGDSLLSPVLIGVE